MPTDKMEKLADYKPTKREKEEEELAMSFQQKLSMSQNLKKGERQKQVTYFYLITCSSCMLYWITRNNTSVGFFFQSEFHAKCTDPEPDT